MVAARGDASPWPNRNICRNALDGPPTGTIGRSRRHTRSGGSGNEKCQPACKPGSVSGMTAGRPFLWDDPCGPPLATYPNDRPGEGWRPVLRRTDRVVPIRSCSRWGLPCRRCCQRRGGLLPHRFTLTPPALRLRRASSREPHCRRGGLFSVALSLGSLPPDVIRHRFSVEPGLSSPAVFRHVTGAAVQPAGARYVFPAAGEVNA